MQSQVHCRVRLFNRDFRHLYGGGHLIGTDLEPSKAERARANVAAAGLAELVEFRVGDARETLEPGVRGDIDLVMLDGAFPSIFPF
jgi:predicted O-methyltransferase YrrM